MPDPTSPSVAFDCPACVRRLTVAARHAGHLVRCPACGSLARVPGTAPSPPPVSATEPTTPLRHSSRPPG